jgi:hypothetical protein
MKSGDSIRSVIPWNRVVDSSESQLDHFQLAESGDVMECECDGAEPKRFGNHSFRRGYATARLTILSLVVASRFPSYPWSGILKHSNNGTDGH